jgi:hypothetical protein
MSQQLHLLEDQAVEEVEQLLVHITLVLLAQLDKVLLVVMGRTIMLVVVAVEKVVLVLPQALMATPVAMADKG